MGKRIIEITDYLDLRFKPIMADAQSLIGDMKASNKKPLLRATIDATHSGRLTNMRVYPGKYMKAGTDTFMKPSPKPILKFHNDEQDPIGRVASADYIQIKQGYDFENDFLNPGDGQGSGFIRLGVNIMDADSIDKFLDGRYKNVSTRQHCDVMLCSICGDNMGDWDSECEHTPGKEYKIEGSDSLYKCYGITGKLSYKECSVVNIPGDIEAEIKEVTLDNEDSYKMSCMDTSGANVENMVLSDGENEVHLMANAIKNKVTAKDRKKLTGKTIVAVSPVFNPSKLQSLANEDDSMTQTKTDAELAAEKKTTTTDVASDGSSKPDQADAEKKQKEGVVAPDADPAKTHGAGKAVVSDAALVASIEALTKSLAEAKALSDSLKAETDRLKATIKERDEQLDKLRLSETALLADLKTAQAFSLVSNSIVLRKPSVAGIVDMETFNAKVTEYASRSIDSLKDSMSDLAPELVSYRASLGIKPVATVVADKKPAPLVSNTPLADKPEPGIVDSDEKAINAYFGS